LTNERNENEKLRCQNYAVRLEIEKMMKVMETSAIQMEKEQLEAKNFAMNLFEENTSLKEILSFGGEE
jgi:hypothetical protein